jgi:Ion transport protein
MQIVGRDLPGFAVLRALRLVRMFRLLSLFKGHVDLITAALLDCFTTLTTILFLVVLAGAIASALILAVEAQHTNSLTQVRTACPTHLCILVANATLHLS